MFPTKTNMAPIMTIAKRRGESPFKPACVNVEPSPGYENTCSANTEPPNNSPKYEKCNVIAGTIAFLMQWFLNISKLFSPLAFAKVTYSLFNYK